MHEAKVMDAWMERELEAKNAVSKLVRLNVLHGKNPTVSAALADAIKALDTAGAVFAGEED